MKYENLEAATKICDRLESLDETIEQIDKANLDQAINFEISIKGISEKHQYISQYSFTLGEKTIVSGLLFQASAELKQERIELLQMLDKL